MAFNVLVSIERISRSPLRLSHQLILSMIPPNVAMQSAPTTQLIPSKIGIPPTPTSAITKTEKITRNENQQMINLRATDVHF